MTDRQKVFVAFAELGGITEMQGLLTVAVKGHSLKEGVRIPIMKSSQFQGTLKLLNTCAKNLMNYIIQKTVPEKYNAKAKDAFMVLAASKARDNAEILLQFIEKDERNDFCNVGEQATKVFEEAVELRDRVDEARYLRSNGSE